MNYIVVSDELYHYGLKGMKWGTRRWQYEDGRFNDAGKLRYFGQTSSRRSSGEKDPPAGYFRPKEKAIDTVHKKSYNPKEKSTGLTDKQKTALKVGATAVGIGLAVYGGYMLYKTGNYKKVASAGEAAAEKLKNVKLSVNMFGGAARRSVVNRNAGRTIGNIDRVMVRSINRNQFLKPGGMNNCSHTSLAYSLNTLFGFKCTAKPFSGIDEVSGMKVPGRTPAIFKAIFNGIKEVECSPGKDKLSDVVARIPKGSSGIIMVRGGGVGLGHYVNFEKAKNGAVTIIDAQTNSIYDLTKRSLDKIFAPLTVFDLSEATLKDGAEEVLKFMINR